MATSSASAVVPVQWDIQQITLGNKPISVARLVVEVSFSSTLPGIQTVQELCWFDTAAPLSVIPFRVHHKRLAWTPTGIMATWMGQPCDIGQVDMWVPTGQLVGARGPYPILAKFARRDPPGGPYQVLFGLHVVQSHLAEVLIRPPPNDGTITFP